MNIERIAEIYDNNEFSHAAQALSEAIRLADEGDTQAALYAGIFCYGGFGTERDFETAVKYLQIAADAGYIIAMRKLGQCCYTGYGVGGEDFERAYALLREAADGGDKTALDFIREFHFAPEEKAPYESKFRDKTLTELSFPQCNELAHNGNASMQYLVGKYYLERGRRDDAAEWLAYSAEAGFNLAAELLWQLKKEGI